MDQAEVIEICREAIIVMLKLSVPILLTGLVVGICISLVQTMTQIQEMTLTFVPKLLVVFLVTLWLLPFMLSVLGGFTQSLADRIVHMDSSG